MKRSEAVPPKRSTGITVDQVFDEQLSMGPGYEQIVGRLFSLDPIEEYTHVERFLDGIGKPVRDMTWVQIAEELEQVENHAWRAAKLLAHALDARDAFEMDAKVIDAAMKAKAKSALEASKAGGEFTKAITIGDVDAYAAAHFTNEYKKLANQRSKAKHMVDAIERAADLLKHRRNTLDTITKGAR